ncbi:MAG: DUF4190 domain-containing protein [Akkermansiaceae bacterium]|nr:DUF4190 domain-containing protein [Akkermansiaceae bacterium]
MNQQPPPIHRTPASDATGGVIPYKNVPSLVGYYLGVFSLIPVIGLLLGPAAIILGIIGFRAYLKQPGRRGQVHAWVAIVLGTLTVIGNLLFLSVLFFK